MEVTGRIAWFNVGHGIGFIIPDSGGEQVFLHHADVMSRTGLLRANVVVSYVQESVASPDGRIYTKANSVCVIDLREYAISWVNPQYVQYPWGLYA